MGHRPYGEIICCLLKQTTITTACNRARDSMRRAVPGVNARWRPPESKPPLAKSFILRQAVCKRLIFLKWHGRAHSLQLARAILSRPRYVPKARRCAPDSRNSISHSASAPQCRPICRRRLRACRPFPESPERVYGGSGASMLPVRVTWQTQLTRVRLASRQRLSAPIATPGEVGAAGVRRSTRQE